MKNITLGECIVGIWRDAWRALQRMPLLFLLAFALTLGALAAVHWFDVAVRRGNVAGGALAWISSSEYLRASFHYLGKIATVVVAVPLVRFAMSDDLPPASGNQVPSYLRYALLWLAFINVGVASVFVIMRLAHLLPIIGVSDESIAAVIRTARVMTMVGFSYIAARLALVLPHIALGGRLEWRTAWEDTKAHFWAIAAVYFIAALLPTEITGEGLLPVVLAHVSSVGVALFISAFFCVFAIYVNALSLAWIYKRFAVRLIATMDGRELNSDRNKRALS
jgi:hypothetical protein